MSRVLLIMIVLSFLSSPAGALWAGKPCTKEAKVCPDGSSVGRGGPNCEFAACPGEAAPGGADGSNGTGANNHPPVPPVTEDSGASQQPDQQTDQQPLPPQGQLMCTMDAKICPDGTGVGRTGPNCEFAPCPGE